MTIRLTKKRNHGTYDKLLREQADLLDIVCAATTGVLKKHIRKEKELYQLKHVPRIASTKNKKSKNKRKCENLKLTCDDSHDNPTNSHSIINQTKFRSKENQIANRIVRYLQTKQKSINNSLSYTLSNVNGDVSTNVHSLNRTYLVEKLPDDITRQILNPSQNKVRIENQMENAADDCLIMTDAHHDNKSRGCRKATKKNKNEHEEFSREMLESIRKSIRTKEYDKFAFSDDQTYSLLKPKRRQATNDFFNRNGFDSSKKSIKLCNRNYIINQLSGNSDQQLDSNRKSTKIPVLLKNEWKMDSKTSDKLSTASNETHRKTIGKDVSCTLPIEREQNQFPIIAETIEKRHLDISDDDNTVKTFRIEHPLFHKVEERLENGRTLTSCLTVTRKRNKILPQVTFKDQSDDEEDDNDDIKQGQCKSGIDFKRESGHGKNRIFKHFSSKFRKSKSKITPSRLKSDDQPTRKIARANDCQNFCKSEVLTRGRYKFKPDYPIIEGGDVLDLPFTLVKGRGKDETKMDILRKSVSKKERVHKGIYQGTRKDVYGGKTWLCECAKKPSLLSKLISPFRKKGNQKPVVYRDSRSCQTDGRTMINELFFD